MIFSYKNNCLDKKSGNPSGRRIAAVGDVNAAAVSDGEIVRVFIPLDQFAEEFFYCAIVIAAVKFPPKILIKHFRDVVIAELIFDAAALSQPCFVFFCNEKEKDAVVCGRISDRVPSF